MLCNSTMLLFILSTVLYALTDFIGKEVMIYLFRMLAE